MTHSAMESRPSNNPTPVPSEERAVLAILWVAVASLMVTGILFFYMNGALAAPSRMPHTAIGVGTGCISLENTPIGELSKKI